MPLQFVGSAVRRLLIPLLLAWPGTALAVAPVLWSVETAEAFDLGTTEGVAVAPDGEVILAPALSTLKVPPLTEAPEPFLWSQAIDSKGTLYLGGGSGGHIYRVPRAAAGSLYYSSGDLAVHAMTIGPSDVLYVATSPNGRILEITGEGKGQVLYEPDDRYIWALQANGDGQLYAATGEHGVIYRITGRGKAEVFFDSDDAHVVSLALDREGRLLAGTDGNGLLYRIGPGGDATVLHDSSLREIKSIAIDRDGVIYAVGVGAADDPSPRPQRGSLAAAPEGQPGTPVPSPVPLPGGMPTLTATVTVQADANGAATPRGEAAPRSEVYRIGQDGSVSTIWSSPTEVIYALAIDRDGRVLVGSGEPGRIRVLSGPNRSTVLARLKESQVTSLVIGPGRRIYAASSNTGRAYMLDEGTSESGIYLSQPRDAGTVSRWGRISWRARQPAGSGIEMTTRSGNSRAPDATWSEWSTPYPNPAGGPIMSPPGRFLQWRARLTRPRGGESPALQSVSTIYVQSNLPPAIESVTVRPPGVVRQRQPYLSEVDPTDLAFTGIDVDPDNPPRPDQPAIVPDKEIYVRGMRAIVWVAEDPNDDRLSYSLSFRGEGEKAWKPLARGLRETYFAFDSMQMPDGLYEVSVEASDGRSNPAEQALSVTLDSEPFTIDNTPPLVQVTSRRSEKKKGSGFTVEVIATDGVGPIARAEYSLDARRFVPLVPRDGVSDSTSESYRFRLESPGPGEHIVIVKVLDLLGNIGAGKAVFTAD
ncbi:MAG: hypothetical protein O7A63_09240 [Acidobacteria bacterium]|nr:hypothetical protein [Acidobacteriota bacterium]